MQDIVIKVRGLEKSFGRKKVLRKVSFDVRRKSIVGFLGPNGAGKTTTIKSILGFLSPDSGSIEILGFDRRTIEVMRKIGYVSETPHFFPHLTGREVLLSTGVLLKMNIAGVEKEVEKISELLALVDFLDSKVGTYSFGTLKKLAFAQAILGNPEILIIDEPYNGLDPVSINIVRRVILSLKDNGTTVFISSHLLSEIEKICDDVVLINRGEIIASDKLETLKRSFRVFRMANSNVQLRNYLRTKEVEIEKISFRTLLNKEKSKLENLIKLAEEYEGMEESSEIVPTLEDIFLNLIGEG